jgi:hypothetical protein
MGERVGAPEMGSLSTSATPRDGTSNSTSMPLRAASLGSAPPTASLPPRCGGICKMHDQTWLTMFSRR